MYNDAIRWSLLALLFFALVGTWIWSQRRMGRLRLEGKPGHSLKILQRRWVDYRTGVCLVEAGGRTFLMAYTMGGGVSWQPLRENSSLTEPANPLPDRLPK